MNWVIIANKMDQVTDRGLYPAREVQRILGINSKNLYYWVQTRRLVAPTEVGRGRGSENLFSLENLVSLSLVQVLTDAGIELWRVKSIFDAILHKDLVRCNKLELGKHDEFPSLCMVQTQIKDYRSVVFEKMNVWALFNQHRDEFLKNGFFMILQKLAGGIPFEADEKWVNIMDIPSFINIFTRQFETRKFNFFSSYTIINLGAIVSNLEEKTGRKM